MSVFYIIHLFSYLVIFIARVKSCTFIHLLWLLKPAKFAVDMKQMAISHLLFCVDHFIGFIVSVDMA